MPVQQSPKKVKVKSPLFRGNGKQVIPIYAGKDNGTGEGGVLVTQDRMKDFDAAKVDANTKADAYDPSDASNIDTPKINVKRGIGNRNKLYQRIYLRQQALRHTQSDGEDSDTGKFDVKKVAKKEATKSDAKRK